MGACVGIQQRPVHKIRNVHSTFTKGLILNNQTCVQQENLQDILDFDDKKAPLLQLEKSPLYLKRRSWHNQSTASSIALQA